MKRIEKIASEINEKLCKMFNSGLIDEEQHEIITSAIKEVFDNAEKSMVEVIDEKHQMFNGMIFSKYKTGYYHRYKKIDDKRINFMIHRCVWEYYNGEIPDGYVVHHKDFDKSNNDISNLQLMTQEEHMKIHSKINILTPRKLKKFTCKNCGEEFESINNGHNHFCSSNCQSAWRRKEKLDNEIRICVGCGKKFSVNKYKKAKYCSQKCFCNSRQRDSEGKLI